MGKDNVIFPEKPEAVVPIWNDLKPGKKNYRPFLKIAMAGLSVFISGKTLLRSSFRREIYSVINFGF